MKSNKVTIVRRGMFETNSSSCHTLLYNCKDMTLEEALMMKTYLYDTIELDEDDNKIYIYPNSYFWDGDLIEAKDKAEYVILEIFLMTNKREKERLEKIFVEVIKEQTKCEDVEYDAEGGYIENDARTTVLSHFEGKDIPTIKTIMRNIIFNTDIKINIKNP